MYGPYFVMKLSAALAPSLSHDGAITALKAARGAIEQSSDFWSQILIVSTAIVAAGVVLEIVAEALEVRKDLKEGKKFEPFHLIAFIAAAVVALFVGVEGVAELKVASKETDLRANNSAEQLELQASANDAKQAADKATSQAVALAERVGGLDALVAQTNGKLDELAATASDQKARSDAIIAALTAKQKEVSATIEAAKEDETELRGSADTIRDLRSQLRNLTAHRILSQQQIASFIRTARLFVGTDFDLTIGRDSDSPDLGRQIALALRDGALWDWKPTGSLGAVFFAGGLPGVGTTAFSQGVELQICPNDFQALSPAVEAIFGELFSALAPTPVSRGFIEDKQQQDFFHCGIVHIFVGPKL